MAGSSLKEAWKLIKRKMKMFSIPIGGKINKEVKNLLFSAYYPNFSSSVAQDYQFSDGVLVLDSQEVDLIL